MLKSPARIASDLECGDSSPLWPFWRAVFSGSRSKREVCFAFDGDKSPAESADKSAASKVVWLQCWKIRVHPPSPVVKSPCSMEYEAVIGLETHVQLKTKSKMWCGCANQYGAEPNTNVCPVCLGLPGVLPVPNDEALRLTVLTGFLLNCEIPRFAKFDRKSYFYPDMPKNYLITQYDRPSTANGYVSLSQRRSVARPRVTQHLEEDSKSFLTSHSDWTSIAPVLLWKLFPSRIHAADMAYEYLNALKEPLYRAAE
jgi:hypothetical protein